MSSGLTVPVIAGLAIGIGLVVLFGILPVSFQQDSSLNSAKEQRVESSVNNRVADMIEDDQKMQLNKEISGHTTKPQMIVSDDSGHIYAVWIASVENQDTRDSENLFRFYFSHSVDNGTTFSQPLVIGNSTDPQDLQMVAQGDNHVYIVWNEGDVIFTRSSNGGQTFSDPVNLSNSSVLVSNPRLAASGNLVFIAWSENTPERVDGRIYLRTSHDYGASFGDTTSLNSALKTDANSLLTWQGRAQIAALNESLAFIKWTERYEESASAVRLAYCTDGGKTFATHLVTSASDESYSIEAMHASSQNIYLELSNDTGLFLTKATFANGKLVFTEPVKFGDNIKGWGGRVDAEIAKILFEGERIYILYAGNIIEGADYYFTRSLDGGETFSDPVKLFGYGNYNPDMAANGQNVYVIRTDPSGHGLGPATELHLLVSTDGGSTFEEAYDYEVEQNANIYSPSIEGATEPDVVYLLWDEDGTDGDKILFTRITGTDG